MTVRKAASLAAAVAVALAAPAGAASIVNGSFEDGIDPGSFTTINAVDSTSITGWTVGDGSIDYIGSYWTAQDGSRSIDLSGNSIGTISQEFATVAGQAYAITYWVSKNPDGGDALRTGTISVGGSTGGFSYSGVNDKTNMNWAQETFGFIATGATTTLSFSSDASGGCCYGPALDNVSIAAVPEPSAWALIILGFGMVGGALRRSTARRVALRYS